MRSYSMYTALALAWVVLGAAAAPQPVVRGPVAASATALIDVDSRALPVIPQSFLGLSHEWPYVEEMSTQPKYMDLLNYLASFGGGPVSVRVGGGSTDAQDFVPSPEVWQSLADLHRGTGSKLIIGINLESGDTDLALKQAEAAKAALPAGSILAFEIGNEPNFYNNKTSKSWQGDVRTTSGETYIECCFWTDWENTAKKLACPTPDNCAATADFAGPAWGHVNVRPSTINWFLNVNGKYVGLVTVHWYKATMETPNTAVTLLDDAPMRKEMANLKTLVGVAQKYGKPLRVAEMNSISNSGRDGVSNVFASALWTLDAAFEVAATGAVGINLHQGAGQNLYSALIRWYDSANNVRPVGVRPVFYGMVMLQRALGRGAQLLPAAMSGASEGVKVWPLWAGMDKQLRVVIINKRPTEAVNVTLAVAKPGGWGPASILRLTAGGPAPLEAKHSITVGGVYFNEKAEKVGTQSVERVLRGSKDGKLTWTIYMPQASAALVAIQRLY
ncbi:MAG: hypothetical protein J3K34DRAFT_480182 [Monoraphidium minutum]|nr:MAG: hypothetical protein J3K34DRAFT_480182 [Monoraphidium minutum]